MLQTLNTLLTALIVSAWVVAIALISIQNVTPVSLRFLIFRTVEIPFGLVLAFCAAGGMVLVAIARPFLGRSSD